MPHLNHGGDHRATLKSPVMDNPMLNTEKPQPNLTDDGWANLLGITLVIAAFVVAASLGDSIQGWFGKPASWKASPLSESLLTSQKGIVAWQATVIPLLVIGVLMAIPLVARTQLLKGLVAYLGLALLSVLAMLLAGKKSSSITTLNTCCGHWSSASSSATPSVCRLG